MLARFLTRGDVAEELAVSRAQAHALVRSGDLPAIKLGGRGQRRVERARPEASIEEAHAKTADWVRANPFAVRDGGEHDGPLRRRAGPRDTRGAGFLRCVDRALRLRPAAARAQEFSSLSRQLQAAFPDLPANAAATAVHEAWRAATLIGMGTVETVERLAREHLAAQLRRQRLIARLRREEARPTEIPPPRSSPEAGMRV